MISFFFFFNDTATTEIYTLSLHDALPIFFLGRGFPDPASLLGMFVPIIFSHGEGDRKSTRLNSSHQIISYAVFCLKKKKNHLPTIHKLPAQRLYINARVHIVLHMRTVRDS